MAEHVTAQRTYLLVWAGLMVLMIATAGLSRIDLGDWSTVVALTIAVAKALLVILFFMHVRYLGKTITWAIIVAGFFWLGILLALTLTDYLTRGSIGVAGH